MSTSPAIPPPETPRPLSFAARRNLWTILFTFWNVLVFLGWLVGPFVLAGTVKWILGWIYFGVLALGVLLHRRHVSRRNPGLLQQRKTIGAGTKWWDIAWNLLFWPLMASIPLAAGYQFSHDGPTMPAPLWVIGFIFFGASITISAWAMSHNPHFEGTVRIQTERHHQVIHTGPYRILRHPGYAGLILWAWATPFLLRSTWALFTAAITILWIILRTALEDATLRRELAGYSDYARQTRYRLFPGVW